MQITFQLTIEPGHRRSAVQPATKTGRTTLADAFGQRPTVPKPVTDKALKDAIERLAHGTRVLAGFQSFKKRLIALEKSLEGLQTRLSDLVPSGDELLTDDDRDGEARPAGESLLNRVFRAGETDPC